VKKFEITLTFSREVEGYTRESAEYLAEKWLDECSLTSEYGPFSSLDGFATVEEVE